MLAQHLSAITHREVPPLQDLDPITPADVGLNDVDCVCEELKAGKKKCHVCLMKAEEGNQEDKKEKKKRKRERDDTNTIAKQTTTKTRSGRTSKKPSS